MSPSPRRVPPPPQPEPLLVEPPFYEATEDLYVYNPEGGSAPAVAYRAGDRVVPDVVVPNGWGGKVRVPDVFAGQLEPPPLPDNNPADNADNPDKAAGKPGPTEKE